MKRGEIWNLLKKKFLFIILCIPRCNPGNKIFLHVHAILQGTSSGLWFIKENITSYHFFVPICNNDQYFIFAFVFCSIVYYNIHSCGFLDRFVFTLLDTFYWRTRRDAHNSTVLSHIQDPIHDEASCKFRGTWKRLLNFRPLLRFYLLSIYISFQYSTFPHSRVPTSLFSLTRLLFYLFVFVWICSVPWLPLHFFFVFQLI